MSLSVIHIDFNNLTLKIYAVKVDRFCFKEFDLNI
jgi:hypothetical protein